MRLYPQAAVALALASMLSLAVACDSGGDGRESSTGSMINPDQKTSETGTSPGSGSDTVGDGEGGTGSSSVPNGKSLEQCTQEGKAWRAVVDGGNSPTDCTDPLVTWCCTRDEVKARFPAMATLLEERFAEFIDTNGMVLYHCSENAADKKFTFHLGKIGNGQTNYKTVFVSQIIPTDTGNSGGNCTQPTTADLQAAGAASPTTDTATGSNDAVTLDFTADIKPVLAAKCGGNACHDDGGTQPATSQWLNDETKFKASASLTRVQAATSPMPPDGSAALTTEEKAKLVDFLTP